jgi:hypothetical protein
VARGVEVSPRHFLGAYPVQSKMDSVIEAWINILIGFIISWTFFLFIISPLFGFKSNAGESFIITVLYTILSFFRQYLIRRWFNGKIVWENWLGNKGD